MCEDHYADHWKAGERTQALLDPLVPTYTRNGPTGGAGVVQMHCRHQQPTENSHVVTLQKEHRNWFSKHLVKHFEKLPYAVQCVCLCACVYVCV